MITRTVFLWIGVGALAGCGGAGGSACEGGLAIAVIPMGTTHEHWKSIHAGAVKAAREMGNVELVWKGPQKQDDREQQNAVAAGAKRLVEALDTSEKLVPALEDGVLDGLVLQNPFKMGACFLPADSHNLTCAMSANHPHNYPKLHNAAWPGVVGKGPDSEPPIDLDTMIEMTASAEVDGQKFEGIDLFLCDPHVSIDIGDDDLRALARKIAAKGLKIGSLVAPVWPPTGGGAAMDPGEGRAKFLEAVEKACTIGSKLRKWGHRPSGVIRIDSATGVAEWAEGDPEAHTQAIAQTFREAAAIASEYGEQLAAEGEICWGGMHSWKKMVRLLELADKPNLGFQADMAHTLLYTMGYNAPEDRILPQGFEWNDQGQVDAAYRKVADALRPWTIDFHVAQNDATVHGTGSHDKTGRHCQVNDPNGKLDVVKHAGYWLRDQDGNLTRRCRHICWDGCMFPNDVMTDPQTWNDILGAMVAVRDAHGWNE